MIVCYSDTARRQLSEIWEYSRRRWGVARADKYVAALYEAAISAAAGETRAIARPDIVRGVSMVRSGSHHIYLVVDSSADRLQVVAILHQRMEPNRHIRRALEGKDDDGAD